LGINEKENSIGMSINGKLVLIKVGRDTALQDDKGNSVNIENFFYYNWGKVWLDRKYSDKQLMAGEAVAVKIIGVQDNAKDITGLGPYRGPADTKDYGPTNTNSK
jgi:hypothetical protein